MDLKDQKLLVIAPHPDDEVLGCAGLIHKIAIAGGEVGVIFLTVGDTRHFSAKGSSTISERLVEIEKVVHFLNIGHHTIEFSGNDYHLQLDTISLKSIIARLERDSKLSLENFRPTIVAMPNVRSYNQDHRVAAKAVLTALRPAELTTKHFVPLVLSYEVPADEWNLSQGVVPNFFLPLTSEEMTIKLKALDLYVSQTRPVPNPRSSAVVEALAKVRGSLCAAPFAEAYYCQRQVLKGS